MANSDSLLVTLIRSRKHAELAELLKSGADPEDNIRPSDQNTARPLHIAAAYGDLVAVKLLIQHGADVSTVDGTRTPISCAAGGNQIFPLTEDHEEVVRYLVAEGANVHGLSPNTALSKAVQAASPSMLKVLWDLGARPQPNGHELDEAGERGNAKVCRALAALLMEEAGALRRAQLAAGLVAAARGGYPACVKAFLEAGADVNARREKGKTALHWNATWGKRQRLDVLNLLIECGADLDILDDDQACPLVWAIAGNFEDLVARLLQAGAEVNRTDAFPPLFQAAYDGKVHMVDLLLDAGADPALINDGKTASDWAREKRHVALAQKLDAAK